MQYMVILKNGQEKEFPTHRTMIEFCTTNDIKEVIGGYYGISKKYSN